MTRWIDTHAHLNDEQFADEIPRILENAAQAGVAHVIVVGIDVASSRRALQLAQQYDNLHAVVGIQPNSRSDLNQQSWTVVAAMLGEHGVVGTGESGLDRYWDFAPIELQREYFVKHLEVAAERDLPIVIHCRDAEADVVDVLSAFHQSSGNPIKGVMHSFCGDVETALRCLELGLHVSFAGMVTFKKNEALRRTAAAVPLDRLLVETDSPYLSPHPLRGKRNQPSHVVHTGACLADVHRVTVEEMAATTTENALRLFGIGNVKPV